MAVSARYHSASYVPLPAYLSDRHPPHFWGNGTHGLAFVSVVDTILVRSASYPKERLDCPGRSRLYQYSQGVNTHLRTKSQLGKVYLILGDFRRDCSDEQGTLRLKWAKLEMSQKGPLRTAA